MKPKILPILLLASFLSAGAAAPRSPRAQQSGPESDRRIWPEFVSLLKSGQLDEGRLKPAYTKPETMMGFLRAMRESATWAEWERQPEMYRVGSLVHFVTRLSEGGASGTYSFTFVVEGGRWYLQHFESIVIRLDQVGRLPVSTFPDIAEDQKAWMREENYWSTMVYLFRQARLRDGDKAFDMFLDGLGYLVQARTWVPMLAPARAFILFSCWEQSRLRGNPVTLERLDENEALVVMDPIFLRLYRQTSHMRELVTEDDYRRIFETIWRDRAAAAGWDVAFAYDGSKVTFRYRRKPVEPAPGLSLLH